VGDQMQWNSVLLGKNTDPLNPPGDFKLEFVNPDGKLIEALQTSDLFLVTANAQHINTSPASFSNIMSIGGWGLQANIGENTAYNDYKNIMIIKGKRGKLFDPNNASNGLVNNPSKWTQAADFAAPTTYDREGVLQAPDISQMVILSQWLQTYFENAAAESGDAAAGSYFSKFNTIAQDDNWTGILFLRVDIDKVPSNLSGIVAGVTDMSAFNAHHLAVEISPVKKSGDDASLDHPSTIFGLIYYVDPQFTDAAPYTTLSPDTSFPYDFRLLTLKVLFENTAVKSFESFAQLTISNLFGSNITKMGDPANVYNNILLKGSFQLNGSTPVYNLSSAGDNVFYPAGNIIKRVTISNAVLTARNSGIAGKATSWFGLRGFIEYYSLQFTVQQESEVAVTIPFDLFSFGNESGNELSGKGLAFNDLGIMMTYTIETPTDRGFVFVSDEISFDTSISTPRKLSIFNNFALEEPVLLSGDKDNGPDKLGYLTVIPDMRLGGVSGGQWYGLK
ncbi:MAG: hypothetical protein ABUT20_66355, partial [Bacteroidota bacterium]